MSAENKTCPYCAEDVKVDARKCKHCGSNLGPIMSAKTKRSLIAVILLLVCSLSLVLSIRAWSNWQNQRREHEIRVQEWNRIASVVAGYERAVEVAATGRDGQITVLNDAKVERARLEIEEFRYLGEERGTIMLGLQHVEEVFPHYVQIAEDLRRDPSAGVRRYPGFPNLWTGDRPSDTSDAQMKNYTVLVKVLGLDNRYSGRIPLGTLVSESLNYLREQLSIARKVLEASKP